MQSNFPPQAPAYQPIRAFSLFESYLDDTIFDSVPPWNPPKANEEIETETETMQQVWESIAMAVLAFIGLFALGSALVCLAKQFMGRRRGMN